MPAVGASAEIGQLLRVSVVCGDQGLGEFRRDMIGTIREVLEFLGMPDHPGSFDDEGSQLMTQVVPRCRVAFCDRVAHIANGHRAAKPTVADTEKFAVPLIRIRQPQLRQNDRVGSGSERNGYSAKGHRRGHRRLEHLQRDGVAARHRYSQGDIAACQRILAEILATRIRRGRVREYGPCQRAGDGGQQLHDSDVPHFSLRESSLKRTCRRVFQIAAAVRACLSCPAVAASRSDHSSGWSHRR